MFRYHLMLGVRSLRRNPVLTALMVLTLAIGVAASMSTLTVLHVMSGDPIPGKSDRLIVPFLDVREAQGVVPGKKRSFFENQVTYQDSMAMLRSGQGIRRTVVQDVFGVIEPARPDLPVSTVEGVGTTADYFPMFEVPFRYGAPWGAQQDRGAADVAVLSRKKAEDLFGRGSPVGRHFRMWSRDFTVVGVVDDWNPVPRYTHVINGNGGSFNGEDTVYVPFSASVAAEKGSNGSTSCMKDPPRPGYQGFLESECIWLQFWFELASPADRPKLRDWLEGYVREQKHLGRMELANPLEMYDVREWLDFLEVVPNDHRAAAWLSLGFLLLCMVNTMGLLLAKFSARAPEIGVRRALGATRGTVFRQFLVEAGVIGLAGGTLGLLLSAASLWAIRRQSRDLSVVAHMDWEMLATTFAIALLAALLAGLLPTWRSAQVTPALQLKSQ
ncbi:ABC transporter permease [Ramlibacter sp. MMS24-I3-19]|uniref:ABC transporter permease n=1 Tax=Ramlibacter sp. MMS24-I3-19 TaxID=3416606 RepID=UPI003D07B202